MGPERASGSIRGSLTTPVVENRSITDGTDNVQVKTSSRSTRDCMTVSLSAIRRSSGMSRDRPPTVSIPFKNREPVIISHDRWSSSRMIKNLAAAAENATSVTIPARSERREYDRSSSSRITRRAAARSGIRMDAIVSIAIA